MTLHDPVERARIGLPRPNGAKQVFALLLPCLFLLCGCPALRAAETPGWLRAWFSAQTNLQTWSADVTQTRSLRALSQPLSAQGHVWFATPNRFRWELTSPSQTIAIREPDQMLVIYPKLKRAERYPLQGQAEGPWKDTLALLDAGFPRSQAELEARFRIVSQTVTNRMGELTLQPTSASARRLMPQLKVSFSTNDFALRATEIQFADGSTLRNEFTNSRINPDLDPGLFTPKLGDDIKIVDPLKK